MRQAIVTTYKGPTNTKGSRIIAKSDSGRTTVSWDHALSSEANHVAAMTVHARKLGWSGRYAGGSSHPAGYTFVDIGAETFEVDLP